MVRAPAAGYPRQPRRHARPDPVLARRKTYRMIEVKGPGDRLQDNQLRWLEFCGEHQMPVTVCYVRWAEQVA
ncbi:VRR-NUC domain-containing protein [Pseudomonas sp. CBSPCBW29]|nr:VRR-NUC domain-containing protein [Pseudomonas sp. CBSPCBW29]